MRRFKPICVAASLLLLAAFASEGRATPQLRSLPDLTIDPFAPPVDTVGPIVSLPPLQTIFIDPDAAPTPPENPILPPHVRPPAPGETAAATSGINRFGFDLLRTLQQQSPKDNSLVSPLSIGTAFAMTYAGAAGPTAEAMQRVFGFSDDTATGLPWLLNDLNTPRDGRELSVVNRLFGAEGFPFRQDYLDTIADRYQAPIERLDFLRQPEASREHINDWVEAQTNDRIQNLLPRGSIKDQTSLVLTNALYFNGDWKHGFKESATRLRPFYAPDGATQQVETMHQTERFRHAYRDGYQMLEMPYAGDDLSMVLLLPDEVDGLAEIEATYTGERFAADLDTLAYREVSVALPKFTFEYTTRLKDSLKELGLSNTFSNSDGVIDFSGMSHLPQAIDDAYHKTFIDVSESGTEAAAATAVVTIFLSDAFTPPPVQFTVDRSFLFAIRDTHTDAVLFLGRVSDPGSAESEAESPADLSGVPEPAAAILLVLCLATVGPRHRPC